MVAVLVEGRFGGARDVEEVDAEEGDDKAGKEGDGVSGVGGVEALEEDEGGDGSGGGETDIVHGVYAGRVGLDRWERGENKDRSAAYTFVEKVSRALLK